MINECYRFVIIKAVCFDLQRSGSTKRKEMQTMKEYAKKRRKKTRSGFSRLMVRIGMMVMHSLSAVWGILWALISGIFRMLWYFLCQIGSFFRFLGRGIKGAFSEHNRSARDVLREMRKARKEGALPFLRQILRLAGVYIFGEHGILRTGFNYVMPVFAVVFLIAIVQYGTGLEYAINVVCNGEELGIITDESEFKAAEAEVRQRISTVGSEADVSFTPTYTLKIISGDDQYVTSQTLADKLLAGSKESLAEAYGVYVDGEFVAAVAQTDTIKKAMDRALSNYASNLSDLVNEVYYTKEITYRSGIYLTDSLTEVQDVVKVLTAKEEKESTYVIQSGDSPQLVAAKFDMTMEELTKLNPHMDRNFREGGMLKVKVISRYIPIAHTKNLTVMNYIDYASIEVETSALNVGAREVISRGTMGEKTSEVLVTYIDGVESSREILSSAITKEPIPEQIGIGTYSPKPASDSLVIQGNGLFGWPVNGGYISDNYISDRNHKGVDIAAPYGTEIYAAGSGTVIAAGWNSGGYGNYVIIEHENGYRTLYGHCSLVVAYEGQVVEKGQLIAKIGSTGDSTGNHCHFEVRLNNICTNPNYYLKVNCE